LIESRLADDMGGGYFIGLDVGVMTAEKKISKRSKTRLSSLARDEKN